ncbi:FAD synthase [Purpureocillium takamizusanense]|uniref:FAD synthase n=1 Tax=Purpureocillium takamizusanense TaxID=2060973 RepID=A0A9Q8QRE2_9HYPO|nr:FAD synthase [Purpureocillium takamizusanense]UNI23384.1 FAD synthase [Purpureocillium takamizusanense]
MTRDGHPPVTNGSAKVPHVATPADADASPRVPRVLPDVCHTLRRKVLTFLDGETDDKVLRSTQVRARESMVVIEEALQRYGPDELSLSYNGGKDCLVLLILILACLPAATAHLPPKQPAHPSGNGSPPSVQPLKAIYIAPPDPFPEVEDFVSISTAQYHLDLTRYALPMRQALEAYQRDQPLVRAIFMGTRRTDPHSEFLTPFSPTDGDWPQLMRVNPVLDWHYAEIWTVSSSSSSCSSSSHLSHRLS